MNQNELFPGRFLNKEDLRRPTQFTVKYVGKEFINVGGDEEEKPIVYFEGPSNKPWVLNKSNYRLIAEMFSEETDLWTGKVITLYVDPNISFGGKKVGGIRVRIDQDKYEKKGPDDTRPQIDEDPEQREFPY